MRLFLALMLLLAGCGAAAAQSSPGFTGSSRGNNAPLTADALNNAFATKQDFGGDMSTGYAHATGSSTTRSVADWLSYLNGAPIPVPLNLGVGGLNPADIYQNGTGNFRINLGGPNSLFIVKDSGGNPEFQYNPVNGTLSLGEAGHTTGAITLNGATSGGVNETVAPAAGSWTFQLPTSAGSAGALMDTTGGIGTRWVRMYRSLDESGATCNGTADDTIAIQTFLNGLAYGSTVIGPANTTCTIQSANLIIPPGIKIVGAGSPLGVLGYYPAHASFVLQVAPAYTVMMGNGTELDNFEITRYGIIANPTAAQVAADHATWLTDHSTGILIGTNAQGVLIKNMLVIGFHFGLIGLPGDWEVDSFYGDDSTLIYTGPVGDYAKVDYARVEPWECINSSNCGTVGGAAWANYGTGFYFVGVPYLSHLGCEFFATCYEFSNPASAHFVDSIGEGVSAVVPFNSGSTAPQNGWGSVGLRLIGGGGPNASLRGIGTHWFSTNVADDSSTGLTYDSSELSVQVLSNSPFQQAMYLWSDANPAITNNKLIISGTPSAGSTITVNVSGAALAPQNPNLSQTAGGSLSATTYYVKLTCGTATSETTAGPEKSFAVSANNLLVETYPPPQPGCTGYNVYVGTSTGGETKQNASLIAYGINWTEPSTGLIAGVSLPASNNTAWSTSDSYTAGSVPGWSESVNLTIPLMLEYAINTDPILQGYHIGAYYGTGTVTVFQPNGLPVVTITASATGGLSVAQSTAGAIGPSNPSTGVITNPIIVGNPGNQFPLLATIGGGDAWWTLSNFGGAGAFSFPWTGWAVGLNPQDTTFSGIFWGLLGGNGQGSVSGTGCTFGGIGSVNKNNRFIVNQASGSTGCTVTFSVPLPTVPICTASVTGSTPVMLGLASATGISWTNASLGTAQNTVVSCQP